MKIRTDFVTNSSSSSYIVFTIENEKLAEVLKRHDFPYAEVNGSKVTCHDVLEETVDCSALRENRLTDWVGNYIGSFEYLPNSQDLINAFYYHRDEISSSFDSADIKIGNIISDGYGSEAIHYIYDGDQAECTYLDEDSLEEGERERLYESEIAAEEILDLLEEYGEKTEFDGVDEFEE